MGQRRKDREWPRPRHTHFVWIRSQGVHVPPVQGYVLEWRRHSFKWFALVLYADERKEADPIYVQEWFKAEQLRPVKSDPNDGFSIR